MSVETGRKHRRIVAKSDQDEGAEMESIEVKVKHLEETTRKRDELAAQVKELDSLIIRESSDIKALVDELAKNVTGPVKRGPGRPKGSKNHTPAQGEQKTDGRASRAKLSLEKARAIRAKYAQGNVTQKELAKEYGVSVALVGQVVQGKAWPEPAKETLPQTA